MTTASATARASAVLHVGGLYYASEKAVVEHVLGRRPGVISVDANPVAQTATVVYDPELTSVQALREWVEECGYHCAGSRRRATCAIRWSPQITALTITRRRGARTRRMGTVTAVTPACRWRRWWPTCETASWCH
jgi:copper chaperone CopZ